MKNLKKVIAKVKCGNSSGTAFLIDSTHALTAAHVIDEGNEEKIELTFFNLSTKIIINGKALDLNYSIDENVDAVIIELEKEAEFFNSKIQFIKSDLPETIRWNSYAFPSLKQYGEPLRGYINNTISANEGAKWDVDLFCENNLSHYKGASGSPLIVNGKIAGLLIEESDNSLAAISTKKLETFLIRNKIGIIED